MQSSLAITALVMGLAGGPHCIAMCGAACAGFGQAAGERRTQAMWSFQLGRVLGYSALGALAAATVQGLGWLTTQSAALRPVWTMLHVAAFLLGVLLLVQARQPLWLDTAASRLWARVRAFNQRWGMAAPAIVGVLWALMPCGLLYSALRVAALSSQVWLGLQRQLVGRAMVASQIRKFGRWPLGHAPGRHSLGRIVGLGLVDGLGP